jgi:hypothetical protein
MKVIHRPTVIASDFTIEDISAKQLETIRKALQCYITALEIEGRTAGITNKELIVNSMLEISDMLKKTEPPTEILSFQPRDLADFKQIIHAVANNQHPKILSTRLNELNEQMKEL